MLSSVLLASALGSYTSRKRSSLPRLPEVDAAFYTLARGRVPTGQPHLCSSPRFNCSGLSTGTRTSAQPGSLKPLSLVKNLRLRGSVDAAPARVVTTRLARRHARLTRVDGRRAAAAGSCALGHQQCGKKIHASPPEPAGQSQASGILAQEQAGTFRNLVPALLDQSSSGRAGQTPRRSSWACSLAEAEHKLEEM
ncbi:hypothetical protein HPB51_018873 [Rhipicephalus microplus]|uniref:Uncharacterized protein n=1 Tax=Rhipicephalus microplus TaxID=6941 RepID=A0A9J6DPB2_RHIMP|nr:hypothetical protein HPB51_018873 [Rhipicephalus microplus]